MTSTFSSIESFGALSSDSTTIKTGGKDKNPRKDLSNASLQTTVDALATKRKRERERNAARAAEAKKAHKQYQRSSWLTFAVVFTAISSMEIGALVLCFRVSDNNTAPLSLLLWLGNEIKTTFDGMKSNSTGVDRVANLKTLLKLTHAYPKTVAQAIEVAHKIEHIVLVPIVIQTIILVAVIIALFVHRNAKVVKSRGRPFLIHFFVAAAFTMISSSALALNACLLFVDIPPNLTPASEPALRKLEKDLRLHTCLWSTLSISFVLVMIAAFVQRQYMIAQLFNRTVGVKVKNVNYWKYFWVQFIVIFVVVAALLVWAFKYNFNTSQHWAMGSVFIPITVYGGVFLYFVVITKEATVVFSDFQLNIRSFVWIEAIMLALVIQHQVWPGSILSVSHGWTAAIRCAATVTALDISGSLYFMNKHMAALNAAARVPVLS